MSYGIILPMDKVLKNTDSKNVCGGEYVDFSILGNVELPEGSVIVRRNENLPEGKLKIIEADNKNGVSDSKGIIIVESSEPSMQKLTNLVIEKMGYSNINKMYAKELNITEDEYLLTLNYEKIAKLAESDPDKFYEIINILSNKNKLDEVMKNGWEKFAKNYNFSSFMQAYLPWHRADILVNAILLLSMGDNSWDAALNNDTQDVMRRTDKISEDENMDDLFSDIFDLECFEDEKIDYKKEFLTVLDEIEKQLPLNKNIDYDLNTMRKILIESKTPIDALNKIKNELHLLPMPIRDENSAIPTIAEIYMAINMLLAISQDQKEAFIYPQLK